MRQAPIRAGGSKILAPMLRPANLGAVKLFVVHHHFRPGGIRRVIELAVPPLVVALRPRVQTVVLLGGEPPEAAWFARFRSHLGALPVATHADSALRYVAEAPLSPARRRHRLARFFEGVFARPPSDPGVVWAHNLSLGRNPELARALTHICAKHGYTLLLHHHDWWFDNRWQRWPEMRQSGFRTLGQVADAILSTAPRVRHLAINRADAAILRRHLGPRAGWQPNLAELAPRPSRAQAQRAQRWLAAQLGEAAPVWLLPCRLLRRKNLAEALLLTRWLRPDAWLVTTGGVSSADEAAYARRLEAAARAGRWKLRLGLLGGGEVGSPAIPELLAASEAVLLTSLLEGFGLPYLEAAVARRPLIARTLPNIAPDLAHFGFRFPQAYREIRIDPALFDWRAELARQQHLYSAWRQALPRTCRAQAGLPPLLLAGDQTRPVPFSQLTLQAQLEVLQQPLDYSWRRCAPLNPFLVAWCDRAARCRLALTPWPQRAAQFLGGAAYAARFAAFLADRPPDRLPRSAGRAAQADFIRRKLAADNLYPLLWST